MFILTVNYLSINELIITKQSLLSRYLKSKNYGVMVVLIMIEWLFHSNITLHT